ncbi:uncharacterized protein GGS25DRAFT_503582 [Hypoxylon fragiforme]|uniref:uncharacterized protein n=1 Tax=Hypoxylon fragiforme TaxID=63214 RepID=UPI0020C72872|nr:uncharacterized protein GGS25DRAFT_503582 [Hypoxylon fragiforme]KAI2605111.1 hypothetical protein GGS25DRAFT_503582 [Hypoxylon fragiforme]
MLLLACLVEYWTMVQAVTAATTRMVTLRSAMWLSCPAPPRAHHLCLPETSAVGRARVDYYTPLRLLDLDTSFAGEHPKGTATSIKSTEESHQDRNNQNQSIVGR